MLETIRIQNFKSLRDVTLNLKQINLLIGPNNSGKSNFLKALELYSDILNGVSTHYEKLTDITFQHNPVNNPNTLTSTPIRFQTKHRNQKLLNIIDLYFDKNGRDNFGYSVISGRLNVKADFNNDILLNDLGSIVNVFETFVYGAFNHIQYRYGRGSEKIFQQLLVDINHDRFGLFKMQNELNILNYLHDKYYSSSHWQNSEIDKKISDGDLKKFIHDVRNIFYHTAIYKPDPSKMLLPYPTNGNNFISSDASNIVSFLDSMKSMNQDIVDKIQSDLKECVGEFKEIILEPIHRNRLNADLKEQYDKQFPTDTIKRLAVKDHLNNIYKASEVSEGVIYFIALLAIIHQPNPPKLLLLEEPEKGIHPRRIAEIIRYIQRLASEKDIQVIMTTHSPLVLDEFAHDPESIFVFDKENGETVVRNLQRDIIDPKNEVLKQKGITPIDYEENLSENWLMGLLNGVPND